jgi:hypothetical protein
VPTSGSRAWVEGLQLPQRAGWRPWLANDGTRLGPQVGGYVVEYEGALRMACCTCACMRMRWQA